jgi:alpha-galactosidase
MRIRTLLLTLCFPIVALAQTAPPLAPTPPMGWNSWNTFQTKIDETLIEQTADTMIANGMRDAGYNCVNLDDGWSEMQRDANGNLVGDLKRFPHGMKALGDYLHQRGFKFGIYNCVGTKTCAGYPGGKDHEIQDAKTYASWGVDYLKYDWCNTEGMQQQASYKKMSDALRATGRPIIFSLCEWGSSKPWLWANGIGQLWRTTGDIDASYESHNQWTKGWKGRLEENIGLDKYAGPGHWNDPDMLEVGNGPLTTAESRSHFSFWCMLAAPLIAGNDVRNMKPEIRDILVNPDLVAIDQDPLGKEGFRVTADAYHEIWAKELSGGDWAVCLFNPGPFGAKMHLHWNDLYFFTGSYSVRDLWNKKNLGTTDQDFNGEIGSHDIAVFRLHRE